MTDRLAISDIVADVEKNNSAVLFLDTCSILDIIRALKRNKVEAIQDANYIMQNIKSGSINCKIVLFSLLEKEFNDNVNSPVKDLKKYFMGVSDASKSFYDANKIFGNKYGFCNFSENPLTKQVISLASEFIDEAVFIENDAKLELAAYRRATNNKPPASKGKPENKDCLLVEEYLEVCRQLKQKNINVPLLLYSSNTSDFCDVKNKALKQELIQEFQANGLTFCYSWDNVLSELQKNRI